jgi:uncharacterized protein YodC (DUF2158 family)
MATPGKTQMAEKKFSVGNPVRLKSGGPPMTIAELLSAKVATCSWFDKARKHHQQDFPVQTLEEASPGDYWDG